MEVSFSNSVEFYKVILIPRLVDLRTGKASKDPDILSL
jgi:hypothetical protein